MAPSSTHGPLLDNPAVRALLTVLDATATGLTGEHALALLTGPIGFLAGIGKEARLVSL